MDFLEINHLLQLARLEMSEEEKQKIARDLNAILDYVNQLQKIDTINIEPMNGGTFEENVLREDIINHENSNLKKEGYFEVPPIF
ncbi:MAG: Asp-tRNA(Asn)/Glu-tRNA(Gln) amidotransferase subunit GatC [Minisyncoccia bacterium]|jgi:aspartyl-tRNA(Asn)/glutamyl-tRNA(Gln) amidotransferase subunit C